MNNYSVFSNSLVTPLTFESSQSFMDGFVMMLESGYSPDNPDVVYHYANWMKLRKANPVLCDEVINEFDDLMTNSVMEGNQSRVLSYLANLFGLGGAQELVNTFHGQNDNYRADEDRMILLTRMQNYLMRLRTNKPQAALIPAEVLFNFQV